MDSSQAWTHYTDKCRETGSDRVVQMNPRPQSPWSSLDGPDRCSAAGSNVAPMPSNWLWKAKRLVSFSSEDSPLAVCLPDTAQNPAAHQTWSSTRYRAAGSEPGGVSLPEEHTEIYNDLKCPLQVCQSRFDFYSIFVLHLQIQIIKRSHIIIPLEIICSLRRPKTLMLYPV